MVQSGRNSWKRSRATSRTRPQCCCKVRRMKPILVEFLNNAQNGAVLFYITWAWSHGTHNQEHRASKRTHRMTCFFGLKRLLFVLPSVSSHEWPDWCRLDLHGLLSSFFARETPDYRICIFSYIHANLTRRLSKWFGIITHLVRNNTFCFLIAAGWCKQWTV